MQLTVAICTFGRPAQAVRLVGECLAQMGEDQLLVVDQSSPWDTRQLSAQLPDDPRVELSVLARRGLPAARNVALASARYPVLVFFDDDVHLQPGCLDAFRQRFADPSVAGVSGRIVETQVAPNTARLSNRIGLDGRVHYNMDAPTPSRIESLKGCNMAFRVELLRRLGGFDTEYGGTAFLEDADASERVLRSGGVLWFEPEAAVVHASHPSAGVRSSERLYDWWRFHNTARFVHRHRTAMAQLVAGVTFRALAVRLAARHGDPAFFQVLMDAWRQGAQTARAGAGGLPPRARAS